MITLCINQLNALDVELAIAPQDSVHATLDLPVMPVLALHALTTALVMDSARLCLVLLVMLLSPMLVGMLRRTWVASVILDIEELTALNLSAHLDLTQWEDLVAVVYGTTLDLPPLALLLIVLDAECATIPLVPASALRVSSANAASLRATLYKYANIKLIHSFNHIHAI
jgi:hypothetical protein